MEDNKVLSDEFRKKLKALGKYRDSSSLYEQLRKGKKQRVTGEENYFEEPLVRVEINLMKVNPLEKLVLLENPETQEQKNQNDKNRRDYYKRLARPLLKYLTGTGAEHVHLNTEKSNAVYTELTPTQIFLLENERKKYNIETIKDDRPPLVGNHRLKYNPKSEEEK